MENTGIRASLSYITVWKVVSRWSPSISSCFLLSLHKFWVIDKAIPVAIIHIENRVNKLHQFIILEDFLSSRCSVVRVMVTLF
jgi:hypothetical protein